jgi:hypothetical protein
MNIQSDLFIQSESSSKSKDDPNFFISSYETKKFSLEQTPMISSKLVHDNHYFNQRSGYLI